MRLISVCFEIDFRLFEINLILSAGGLLTHAGDRPEKKEKNNGSIYEILLQSTLLSGTTMMKHTEMFSTREYTTKNNSHLTKTRTTRKIQLTF